jgi:Flp pilus assembly protein TadD
MQSAILAVIAGVGLLALSVVAPAQTVRAWQGTLTLPSYDEGSPDVNPPFDLFSTPGRPNYPYTIRDQLTDRRRFKAWRALFLENEYLRCSVLPDLGGHLYGCTDKINNQEVFYANSSIKLSNIAYRGSWAAFGIEFNFPVSHNWMTTSPVDFALTRDSADGSASIVVGNIDRPYGMHWRVRLTLRPGRAILEQHTTLANYSDVRRRFYWWTNAAVRAFDDTRIEYPMKFTASHGFTDVDTWPVDRRGTDNSVLRNQIYGPVSRFSHGSREGYMGIWQPRTNSGVAHYAAPDELPAKKIWSWGVDADAMDWRRALSDDASAYVEIQAGLFRDQETYAWLPPHDRIEFAEYWMPLRGLGGLTRANARAALNIWRPARDSVAVRLNVSTPYRGARLVIGQPGTRPLLEETIDVSPPEVVARDVRVPVAGGAVTVALVAGDTVIAHEEGRFDFAPDSAIRRGPQRREPQRPTAGRTDAGWLNDAEEREVNGDLLGAWAVYREGLQHHPESVPLTRAIGRLAVSLGRFAEGRAFLDRTLSIQSADHEAAYYRGLARQALGDARGARIDFEFARQFGALQSAADRQLGQMDARDGRLVAAARRLALASARNPKAERLALEAALLARVVGLPTTGPAGIEMSLATTTLARGLGAEGIDPSLARHFRGDPERLIEVVEALFAYGLYARAQRLLFDAFRDQIALEDTEREPGTPDLARHPIVAYYAAFAREQQGLPADSAYRAASELPTTYVFPNRLTTRRILEHALRGRPGDQTARNLLAMLALQRGEVETAVAMWDTVRRTGARYPSLHRNLGSSLLWLGRRDEAQAVFGAGTMAEPSNAAVWVGLDSVLMLRGADAMTRARSLDRYPDRAAMPTALVYRYARLLAAAGRFGDAEALFPNRWFARVEGGTNPRGVWLEVRSARAVALAESGRCIEARRVVEGVARPVSELYFSNDGMQPFLTREPIAGRLGRVRERCR